MKIYMKIVQQSVKGNRAKVTNSCFLLNYQVYSVKRYDYLILVVQHKYVSFISSIIINLRYFSFFQDFVCLFDIFNNK